MIFELSLIAVILVALVIAIDIRWGLILAIVFKSLIDASWNERIGGFSLIQIVSVIVPFAVICAAFFTHAGRVGIKTLPLKPIWGLYLATLFIGCMIIVLNSGVLAGADVFLRQINGIVGFFIVQCFFKDEKTNRKFWWALALGCLFPVAVGLYQMAGGSGLRTGDTEGLTRLVGFYHDSFTTRLYMQQLLFSGLILSALYYRDSNWIKYGLWTLMFLAVVVMFHTYSKSAIATVGVWFFIWTIWRRKFLLLGVLTFITIVVGGVYVDEVSDQIYQMFHKEIGALSGDVKIERTFAGRWLGWEEMIAKWQDASAFGQLFGIGEVVTYAHNDFLMILMHQGIVGLAMYIVLLISIGFKLVVNAFKQNNVISLAGLMVMGMWLIDAIGLVPSAYPGYQWFAMGVMGYSLYFAQGNLKSNRARKPRIPISPARSLSGSSVGFK